MLFNRLSIVSCRNESRNLRYDDESAKAWLYGKLLVALLVEKLIRHAITMSPWGYDLEAISPPQCVA